MNEDLRRESDVRWKGYGVDHPRLKRGEDVIGLQSDRMKTALAIEIDRRNIAGPREQLGLPKISGSGDGRLGEESNPPGVGPEEDDESALAQLLLQSWAQLLAYIIHFVQRSKKHRHTLQRMHGRIDLRQTDRSQKASFQGAVAHETDDVCLAAASSAGIDLQLDILSLPLRPHDHEDVVERGGFRCDCGEPHALLCLGRHGAHHRDQEKEELPFAVLSHRSFPVVESMKRSS